MQNEEEIPKLRELYDELWHDARTLIHDMKEGISMYKFSGILICLLACLTLSTALTGFLTVIAGGADVIFGRLGRRLRTRLCVAGESLDQRGRLIL